MLLDMSEKVTGHPKDDEISLGIDTVIIRADRNKFMKSPKILKDMIILSGLELEDRRNGNNKKT